MLEFRIDKIINNIDKFILIGRGNQKPFTSYNKYLKHFEYKPQINEIYFEEFTKEETTNEEN